MRMMFIRQCRKIRNVSVFSMSGFQGNLPDLHEGRQFHTCARYQDQYDQNVEILLKNVPDN